MLGIIFDIVVIIDNDVRSSLVAARLSAWLELAAMVSYSPWLFGLRPSVFFFL